MRDNYKAWKINVDQFPFDGEIKDKIEFLLRFAVLAPSGHNTQPWNFNLNKNLIDFLINKERALSKSDPLQRQLMISMGCAIENFLIAADYFGFEAETIFLPDPDRENLVCEVVLRKIRDIYTENNHLIFSILKRNSNRLKYKNIPLPREFLNKIKVITGDDIKIEFISDERRNALADCALEAQIESMESPIFREELSHYVKSSLTKSKTGMPGFAIGVPLLLSFFISKLIKRINFSKKSRKTENLIFKKFTPGFFVISTKEDSKKDWIEAGRTLERIWLMGEQEGLKLSILAGSIQLDSYRSKLREILNQSFYPQVFCRVGYPLKRSRHSPRFELEDVLIKA